MDGMHDLVSLVGSSPLANVVAIDVTTPRRVWLATTPQTARVAERIAQVLPMLHERISVEFVRISDAGSAMAVREALDAIPRGWALDYTGGTKVMASQARLAFSMNGADDDALAFYVDDRVGLVRFDDGSTSPAITDLSLGAIASLHGRSLITDRTPGRRPKPADLRHVAHHVCLSTSRHKNCQAALDTVLRERSRKSEWRQWLKGGHWLELAVADLAQELIGEGGEVVWSADLLLGDDGRNAELDVVLRRHQRVGVISCTVTYGESAVPPAKKRLFEVMERSRQLGGPLARAALATLMPPQQVQLLLDDVEAEWDRPGDVVVWGAEDLAAMFNGDTKPFDSWMS